MAPFHFASASQAQAATCLDRQAPRFTTKHQIADWVLETNWRHVAFKTCAYSYIAVILWLAWKISPFGSMWTVSRAADHNAVGTPDLVNYFTTFEGHSECGIQAMDLYNLPQPNSKGLTRKKSFCSKREDLLKALSHGGRHGFDAPYTPRGCHYRWYNIEEICMIMERFDAVIFVGDSTLQTIYSGFNILLRQHLALGSLKVWDMTDEETSQCKCKNQFMKESCTKYAVMSSEDVIRNVGGKHKNSYACQRTPHALLHINSSPAPASVTSAFKTLISPTSPMKYKPVPIIHSLTVESSVKLATDSLSEFLGHADASKRKTPMLWIGPPAAGHIEIKGRKGNQEIWHFATEMERISREKDVEVLGMWNLTVQADSWDGLRFDERVALTQAMMVVNWLSRLESS